MTPAIVIASVMRPEGQTGIQTHFRTFLAALQQAGRSCILLTPYHAPRWQVYPVFALRKALDPLSAVASIWWYRHWHAHFLERALRRRFRNGDACVAYAQCPLAARAALRSRSSPAQRVVAAVHFNISEADEWVGKGMIASDGALFRAIRGLEADVLPRVDGLVFVSSFMRAQLIARVPEVAPLPYAIVPNFVTDPGAVPHSGYDADLISIGTLEPRKNQDYLLDIVAAARASGTPLRLTLVGEGPQRAALECKARLMGVSQLVQFAGFVGNAAQLLGRHRAYVHAARIENLPLTLVEALSRGVPVFAPAVGGIPEMFDDGVEGRVLPLDDAADAARRIVEWLNVPQRMEEAGRAARNRFLREFQTEVAAARLLEFLDTVGAKTLGRTAAYGGGAHYIIQPTVNE